MHTLWTSLGTSGDGSGTTTRSPRSSTAGRAAPGSLPALSTAPTRRVASTDQPLSTPSTPPITATGFHLSKSSPFCNSGDERLEPVHRPADEPAGDGPTGHRIAPTARTGRTDQAGAPEEDPGVTTGTFGRTV